MTGKIEAWEKSDNNGKKPLFLSYQVQTWEFNTSQLVRLHDEIKAYFEGRAEIAFVRADHFFALFNEANGMPFNLCMNSKTTVTSSDASSKPKNAQNGSPAIPWTAKGVGNQWLHFDFGDVYTIARFAVIQPSSDFTLELSRDGNHWEKAGVYKTASGENYIDVDLENPVVARYAKFTFAGDSVTVGDIEIYGMSGGRRN